MEPTVNKKGLIDTDILIDSLRGDKAAEQFLFDLFEDETIPICVITAMELIRGSRNSAELRTIQQFLERFHILPLNHSIANKAYEWMIMFSLSYSLEIPDALIAATASENGLTLFSKNIRHYRMIPNLNIHRPY
ncbi:MAG: type II toxin-antitoxin system VapC family toxin [Candidatus Omnitrophota bacterium]